MSGLNKASRFFGKDYFQGLLEKVRSIRASERRVYLQITDIFSECSIDCAPQSETTRNFYAMGKINFTLLLQEKLLQKLFIIRLIEKKSHMGLATWRDTPKGRIISSDVTVAKNYLQEDEIKFNRKTNFSMLIKVG